MSNEINKDTVDYRDPTPFDDTKLNSITEISKGIRHKLYGKDAREALAQQGEALVKLMQETGGNQSAEVVAARGKYGLLSIREDAQDNAIISAQSTADSKFGKADGESYLNSITVVPETFANLAAIKAKYPSGKNGLMVAADNGHKYIWNGSSWSDAGVYQAVGISDGAISPEKTNFALFSNYNVLDNSTCLQETTWVRDWQTQTLKRLSGLNMFSFAPIYLKSGQTAYTTNIRTSASFILDGTWDKGTQVYTGTWKTIQTFLNADEWQECKIVADKDYILFVTCSVAYATPETSMVFIGDGLPSSFRPFMQGELTIPELVIKTKYLTVNPKDKGCYQTINSAVADAVDGDEIIVYPGSYIEQVKVHDKRIHIIGIDKETCILKTQTGNYLEAPLEIAKGTVSNMTIYSEKPYGLIPPAKTSYGVHIDRLESVGETLTFNNCILKSDFNAGAGIGLRKDFTLTFKNCEFITTEPTNTNGACFFHDSNNSTAYGKGKIIFDNCRLKSASSIVIMPASSGVATDNNSVYMTFYNTILWSDISKNSKSAVGSGRPVTGDGWWLYNNFYLTEDSFGNNIQLFNAGSTDSSN